MRVVKHCRRGPGKLLDFSPWVWSKFSMAQMQLEGFESGDLQGLLLAENILQVRAEWVEDTSGCSWEASPEFSVCVCGTENVLWGYAILLPSISLSLNPVYLSFLLHFINAVILYVKYLVKTCHSNLPGELFFILNMSFVHFWHI